MEWVKERGLIKYKHLNFFCIFQVTPLTLLVGNLLDKIFHRSAPGKYYYIYAINVVKTTQHMYVLIVCMCVMKEIKNTKI